MPDSNKNGKKRGFTLIEVLIVITILLSFSFLMILKKNDKPLILENTANEMVSAARYARACYDAGDNIARLMIEYVDGQHHIRVYERSKVGKKEEISIDIPIDPSIEIKCKSKGEMEYREEDIDSLNGYSKMITNSITISFSGQTTHGAHTVLLSHEDSKYYYKLTIIPTSSRIHLYKLEKK